jgi:hypothetical protein
MDPDGREYQGITDYSTEEFFCSDGYVDHDENVDQMEVENK